MDSNVLKWIIVIKNLPLRHIIKWLIQNLNGIKITKSSIRTKRFDLHIPISTKKLKYIPTHKIFWSNSNRRKKDEIKIRTIMYKQPVIFIKILKSYE